MTAVAMKRNPAYHIAIGLYDNGRREHRSWNDVRSDYVADKTMDS